MKEVTKYKLAPIGLLLLFIVVIMLMSICSGCVAPQSLMEPNSNDLKIAFCTPERISFWKNGKIKHMPNPDGKLYFAGDYLISEFSFQGGIYP